LDKSILSRTYTLIQKGLMPLVIVNKILLENRPEKGSSLQNKDLINQMSSDINAFYQAKN